MGVERAEEAPIAGEAFPPSPCSPYTVADAVSVSGEGEVEGAVSAAQAVTDAVADAVADVDVVAANVVADAVLGPPVTEGGTMLRTRWDDEAARDVDASSVAASRGLLGVLESIAPADDTRP